MSRISKLFFSSLAGLVLFLSIPALAKADPLVLTIQNPNQFALPGTAVTFSATVTNTGTLNANPATIANYLITAGCFCAFSINVSLFQANFNNQVVGVGAPLGPLPAFTITAGANALLGSVITGSFSVIYNGQVSTTRENFSVTVGPAPVPEPATLVLLATGLAGAVGSKRVRCRFTKS